MSELKPLSAARLGAALGCSGKIATQAKQWHDAWSTSGNASSPALLAYTGVAFKKLDVRSLSSQAAAYLASNLLVFDPLYGVVRGTDSIEPYRLELGWKRKNGQSLGRYWREVLGGEEDHYCLRNDNGNDDATSSASAKSILLDLSSAEYGSSLLPPSSRVDVWTVVFLQDGKGSSSVHNKQGRGLVARYCCENEVRDVEGVKKFDKEGYEFKEEVREEKGGRIVFNRRKDWEGKKGKKRKGGEN